MFSGESVNVTFRVQVNAVGAVMDWLADARVRDCGDGFAMATVTVNENAMLYWALQYGMNVEVLEPAALRERVREAVCAMHEKYRGGDGLS